MCLVLADVSLADPCLQGYNKTIGMVNLVSSLRAAGVPIDGIGSQSEFRVLQIRIGNLSSHLSIAQLSAGQATGTFNALQALGSVVPEVAITELDIAGASPTDYVNVMNACLQTSNCVGITRHVSVVTWPASPLTIVVTFTSSSISDINS